MQVDNILLAALRQIRVGGGDHTGRHCRQVGELRIDRQLTGHHHQGFFAGQQRIKPPLPGPFAAQQAHHKHIRGVHQLGQGLFGEQIRVGVLVVHILGVGGGLRRQQIRVRSGKQRNHEKNSPFKNWFKVTRLLI